MSREINGKPLVFLDSAASAQKPRVVLESLRKTYEEEYANVHRGVYWLSATATQNYENVRNKLKTFFNAKDEREFVFTKGTTEGINLVAQSWGRAFLKAGDEVLITGLEHHSNIVPWQMLRDQIGIKLVVAPIDTNGNLIWDAFEKLLSAKTKLVAVAQVSNALGTILPVHDIVRAAHAVGAKVLIDAAQGAPHMRTDLQALDADFYAFSGHKLYGADRHGRAVGQEGAARRHAALAGRRRHDQVGVLRENRLRRRARQVRGRHAQYRRRYRHGRRHRLPLGPAVGTPSRPMRPTCWPMAPGF